MQTKILIVDDEQDTLELVGFNLQKSGYRVITARNAKEALEKVRRSQPDLVILDVMLPGMDGIEICKLLRRQAATETIPIVMLSAKDSELDRVLAFEIGASDYVTKPFSPRELVLRVSRLLRSPAGNSKPDTEKLEFGDLSISIAQHLVLAAGKPVRLTATEFRLLTLLAQRAGRVQSRDQLLREVWGYDSSVESRTVDTHMRRLRSKLGRACRYLETVRGFGYRFEAQ